MRTSFKVIFNEEMNWVLIYSKDGVSQPMQDLIKCHYNVSSLTIVLKDYKGE